jgi:hypothetical protein
MFLINPPYTLKPLLAAKRCRNWWSAWARTATRPSRSNRAAEPDG